jgi:hypothetical protein
MDRELIPSRQMLATIVILVCGLVPDRLSGEGPSRLRDGLTSNLFNRPDIERIERGYYEQLLDCGRRLDDLADVPCLRIRRRSGSTWSIPVDDAPLVVRVDDLREVALRPNDATERWGLQWRTNSQGMRDREYSPHKPPGTIRIAFVGDSIGAGWGVNVEERFESILEEVWDSRARRTSGLKVEIINCAVPGHSPGQRWYHFTQIGWRMDPDLVIYEGTAADVGWDERRLRFLLARGLGWDCPIYNHTLASAGVEPDESPDHYKRALRPIHRQILQGVYQTMAADCRGRDIPIFWVLIPRVGRHNDVENQRSLLQTARTAGFSRVIDVTDAFDGLDPSGLAVESDDFHPNASGHDLLARQLDIALSEFPEMARMWGSSSVPVHGRDPNLGDDDVVPQQTPSVPLASRGGHNR